MLQLEEFPLALLISPFEPLLSYYFRAVTKGRALAGGADPLSGSLQPAVFLHAFFSGSTLSGPSPNLWKRTPSSPHSLPEAGCGGEGTEACRPANPWQEAFCLISCSAFAGPFSCANTGALSIASMTKSKVSTVSIRMRFLYKSRRGNSITVCNEWCVCVSVCRERMKMKRTSQPAMGKDGMSECFLQCIHPFRIASHPNTAFWKI